MPGGYDNKERPLVAVGQRPLGAITDFSVPRRVRVKVRWQRPFALDQDTEVEAWALAYTSTQGLVAFRWGDTHAFCIWVSAGKIETLR